MKAKVLSIITATALFVGSQTYLTKTVITANAASDTQTLHFDHTPTPQPNTTIKDQSTDNDGSRSTMPQPIAKPQYHPVKVGKENINNRDWRPNMSNDSYIINSNVDNDYDASNSSASDGPDVNSNPINSQVKSYTDHSNDQINVGIKQFFSATPQFKYTKFTG